MLVRERENIERLRGYGLIIQLNVYLFYRVDRGYLFNKDDYLCIWLRGIRVGKYLSLS